MMVVPSGQPTSSSSVILPASKVRLVPEMAPGVLVIRSMRLTDAMAARASPRKPQVVMAARSSAVRSLEVAWRRKALLATDNEGVQIMAARKIVEDGLNVRQTEAYIKFLLQEKKPKKKNPVDEEMRRYLASIETKLSKSLGTKVKIQNKKNRGKIEIEYYNNEDFERIMNKIV